MAQMLYREWFVNFRFPDHEQFKMVESELGLIPEGWESKKISDFSNLYRGKSYKSSELVQEGGLPFLNLKCIERDGGFRHDGLKRFQGSYKETQTAKAGDIIIAVTDMTQERRLVARAARVPKTNENNYIFSMDLIKILSMNTNISQDYLYSILRFSEFGNIVKQYANGANVLHLNPERILEFKIALPKLNLINDYTKVVSDIYQKCDILILKNDNLRKTRDLLLPKLISGEIDVEKLGIDTLDIAA